MAYLMRLLLALCCALLTYAASADARDFVGYRLAGQTLEVRATDGTILLTAYGSDAVEVDYDPVGMRHFNSYAIGARPRPTSIAVADRKDHLEFSTPTLRVTIEKRPLRLSYARLGKELVTEETGLFINDTLRGFRFRLHDGEQLWGGGQRVVGMNRRGLALPLDNRAAYGYSDAADAMYFGIPAVLSSRKYLLLFDNPGRGLMDLGKAEPGIMQFQAVAGRTAYLIVAGATYEDVVRNYVAVTGRQPLPPRWAFGNMASRFGYRSEGEARAVVAKFAADDIPLDAIIFDLFWFGPDVKGHLGNLAWDRHAFPDPDRMIRDFKMDGVNTVLITEPFILRSSARWQEALAAGAIARDVAGEPRTFDFYFGTGGLVDMFDPRAADWFWAKNKALLAQGVAGIWGDLGEPELHPSDIVHAGDLPADEVHNAYGHEWAARLYENWRRDFPDERPFVMMRSGFAGSQRYGMIPWSGDASRTWGALQAQIEIGLQMSVLGLAYSNSDLGGFAASDHSSPVPGAVPPFDRELYIRWLQFGAFQPVFRPHSPEQLRPEPVFQDAAAKAIVRRYIRWRYRLLPYIYTMAWRNSETGQPLMRPLSFADDDPALFDDASAYLWGNDLVVAPVTTKGATEKSFPLARGAWFDLKTGERYEGGRRVTIPVTLDDIPVLARAGAFLPMIGDIGSTRDYRTDKLTLHYYDDISVPRSSGQMYEDDGRTPEAVIKGRYEVLDFAATRDAGVLRLALARERHKPFAGQPGARWMTLAVHGRAAAPTAVTVDGVPLAPTGDLATATRAGFAYSPADRTIKIAFPWIADNVAIQVR